jgi:hypothetical protein
MTFIGNLDAAGTLIQGTIAETQPLLASAASTSLVSDIRNAAGASLGLTTGSSMSISGSVGGTLIAAAPLVVGAGHHSRRHRGGLAGGACAKCGRW